MPFTCFASCDLYGRKENLEVEFPAGAPSMSELRSTLQSVFANEAMAIRPSSRPIQSVGIGKIQVFRDSTQAWEDVLTSSQVTEYCQLYIFNSDPAFRESQEQILPARRPSRPVVNANSAASAAAGGGSGSAATMPSVSPPRHGVQQQQQHHHTRSATAIPVKLGVPSASAVSLPPMPRGQVPQAPTQGDKIRFLFEEMDTSANRTVEPSEFQEMLRYLNVDFSNATISDLFRKADSDHDGSLSIKEFTNFFSGYPTLLDALFFRLRDLGELRNLQIQLAQEQDALLAARDRAERAGAVSSEVQKVLDQQRDALAAQEREWESKLSRDTQARNLLRQAAEDVLAAQAQRTATVNDLGNLEDREKHSQNLVAQAGSDAKEMERRHAQQESLLAQAEEKQRQLQALLAEAQRETLRNREEVQVLHGECQRSREREQQASMTLLDVQREAQRARELLSACERDLMSKSEIQRESKRVVDDSQADLGSLRKRIEEQKREIGICADRDVESRQLSSDAAQAVGQQERRVVVKDDEIRSFAQQRSQLEEQERPLLEQEVRLREQRESLEEKEHRLRRESDNLFIASSHPASVGRGGNARSPNRIR